MEMRRNIYIVFTICFVVILFTGCNDNPLTATASLNNDFKIKYGESIYIPGENLTIVFSNVVADSRCPEGAMCEWQGTAEIKLYIRQGNDSKIDTVQTNLPQSVVSIGEANNSYLFEVKDLTPYPKVNGKINKQDYVLTLNISHFTYGFSNSEIENKTGIFGQTYIWPTSPVEREGYISYKPFQISFKITGIGNDTTIVTSDSTGRFLKYLPPGDYKIIPRLREFPILTDSLNVKITEGKMELINLTYDSGIR